MCVAAAFNTSEYIPCLRELGLQGVGRRMKAVAKAFDEFFDQIIEEQLATAGEEKSHRDFVDYILSFFESGYHEFLFHRTNIKAIMSVRT